MADAVMSPVPYPPEWDEFEGPRCRCGHRDGDHDESGMCWVAGCGCGSYRPGGRREP